MTAALLAAWFVVLCGLAVWAAARKPKRRPYAPPKLESLHASDPRVQQMLDDVEAQRSAQTPKGSACSRKGSSPPP